MRTLVVDGYNVLAASPRYRALAQEDLESARAALVRDVVTFAQGSFRAVVVFDGASNPRSDGTPHHVTGAAVLFSAYGVDADTVIEALVHRHRERAEDVVVVTSDAQTQWAVMGPGVSRMSAAEFVAGVGAVLGPDSSPCQSQAQSQQPSAPLHGVNFRRDPRGESARKKGAETGKGLRAPLPGPSYPAFLAVCAGGAIFVMSNGLPSIVILEGLVSSRDLIFQVFPDFTQVSFCTISIAIVWLLSPFFAGFMTMVKLPFVVAIPVPFEAVADRIHAAAPDHGGTRLESSEIFSGPLLPMARLIGGQRRLHGLTVHMLDQIRCRAEACLRQ